MKKFLPSRRKQQDAKPEPEAAVEERTDSSNLEKEIGVTDDTTTTTAVAAAAAPADDPIVYVTGWKLWSMLVSITSVFILVLLDMSIVATVSIMVRFQTLTEPSADSTSKAVPEITSRFHSLRDVGWYGSAYLLARYVPILLYIFHHAKAPDEAS